MRLWAYAHLAVLALWGAARPVAVRPARAPAIAVVVNPNSPVKKLSLDEVRELFEVQRQFWDGGVRVVLVLQADDAPDHRAFLSSVLGIEADALDRIYLQKRYRGVLAAEILVVDSPEAVKREVAARRNAIGYLSRSELDAAGPRVRVVFEP